MKYLRIENAGEIDINAVMLLGASSKEGDESKIGFFGSGNKYAIATLLRNGVGLYIYAGDTEFAITTKHITFRDKDFDQILINGKETSLTTRTGPLWEVWMALREFFCNAIDEGGEEWSVVDEVMPADAGTTAIYVEYTDAVAEMYETLEDYINTDTPLESITTRRGRVDILEGNNGRLFRKNIRANKVDEDSLFHYSFDNIEINESRLISSSYDADALMSLALLASNDATIVDKLLSKFVAGDTQFFEKGISWYRQYDGGRMSETWHKAILAYKRDIISDDLAELIPPEDRIGKLVLPSAMVARIKDDFPDVPIYGNLKSCAVKATPSAELKARVKKALAELSRFGIKNPLPIEYSHFTSADTVAIVTDGVIYISVDPFPDIDLTVVLFEELKHHTTGFGDGSRSLQTLLMTEIVAKNRELVAMEEKLLAGAKKIKQVKALLSA